MNDDRLGEIMNKECEAESEDHAEFYGEEEDPETCVSCWLSVILSSIVVVATILWLAFGGPL